MQKRNKKGQFKKARNWRMWAEVLIMAFSLLSCFWLAYEYIQMASGI